MTRHPERRAGPRRSRGAKRGIGRSATDDYGNSTPEAVALTNGADAGVSRSKFERRACHPRVAHSGCGIPDPPRHRRSRTSSSARRGAGPGHGQGRRSTGLNVQPLWIIVGHEQQLSEKPRAKRSRDLLQRGIKSNWWRKKGGFTGRLSAFGSATSKAYDFRSWPFASLRSA